MTDRDRLTEIIEKSFVEQYEKRGLITVPHTADDLLANGVIVPPCKVGDEIWVIDREDGEAVDISCIQFLAKSKGCVIGTAWINDYDLDETLEFHISETQNNVDTDLKVYPNEDCFLTREEAEAKLRKIGEDNA